MQKALRHLKKSDPVLRPVIERIGPCRMQFSEPTFETLARSIVFQQLSGTVARVIYGRLANALPGGIHPEAILSLKEEQMRQCGLSSGKTKYIRDLARLTADGAVDFGALSAATDEEVIRTLTQVKGVGVWTAQMFLMFALARPDVLPVGDLGIRKAMQSIYGLSELPKPAQMEEIALPWRPYCSTACWYLWRHVDGAAEM